MKKNLLLFLMLVCISQSAFAQNELIEAFGLRRDDSTWWNEGDILVGLQTNLVALGTDVILNGEYFFEPNLSVNARLGYVGYRPPKFSTGYRHRAIMVSGDFHYYAALKKRYAIYAGIGISAMHFGNRVNPATDKKLDPYTFGPSINLNVGAHYRLYKKIELFAEVGRKYSSANVSLGTNLKLR